jgi:hypothetical protein
LRTLVGDGREALGEVAVHGRQRRQRGDRVRCLDRVEVGRPELPSAAQAAAITSGSSLSGSSGCGRPGPPRPRAAVRRRAVATASPAASRSSAAVGVRLGVDRAEPLEERVDRPRPAGPPEGRGCGVAAAVSSWSAAPRSAVARAAMVLSASAVVAVEGGPR